ncbi:NADPH-dependent oxidoreductase [Atopobacter sp. AH10]|uniref:nitroreductase family protein n=1 Tax=Atopobacter sp. AH10 TaxID=2315861 RepID=UPI000EF2783B|nr:nitroreductase family protein [Atopobacter sp. AH10]RLK62735.1 NADPH-dependent oxidoreductase [Atopobacter sp. AH10]
MTTIERQLNHRSIRDFTDQSVDEGTIQSLLAVMNRTASSRGLQSCSIIRLTDQDKKEAIATIAGQPYIAQAPEVWIFIADCYRNYTILHEKSAKSNQQPTLDFLFEAISDSYLAAQNVMVALESLDLGGVFLGSIMNDLDALVELLNLPKFTFPLLGIAFGHVANPSQLKPRMSLDLKVGENSYPHQYSYTKALENYDKEMTNYYDTRQHNRRSDSFTDQVLNHLTAASHKSKSLSTFLQEQGFILDR